LKRLTPVSKLRIVSIFCSLILIIIIGSLLTAPRTVSAAVTLTVNSTADSVDVSPGNGVCADSLNRCTLRAAVMEANALAGADTINVPAGTYVLTSGPYDDEFNFAGAEEGTGDLDILNGDLTINGTGPGATIIDGNAIDRIFDVNNFSAGGSAVNLTLQGLTLKGGKAPTSADGYEEPGGAIQFDGTDNNTGLPVGTLTINNCKIQSNTASGVGGGVLVIFGSLTVDGSEISGNTSQNASGGGILFDGGAAGGNRSLQLTNNLISGNKALSNSFGNGGGVWASRNANFSISNNSFLNNQAGTNGGGMYSAGNTVTISKNTFEGNSAKQGGGIYNTSVSNNGSALSFSLNVVVNNTAPSNPTTSGMSNFGTATVENNWWGCNDGPGFSPCDRASGIINSFAWLKLSHTANPSTIPVNGTSTLQADFFTNSTGATIPATDLVALDGRTVTFNNAVKGTVSPATAQISGGKANATYTSNNGSGAGSADATVDHETETATINIEQAPSVTTNPADQTVCSNSSASFTASSSGFPTPTVQWQVSTDGGANFTNISGATATTLTFTATAADNGKQYRAVFTNSQGSATSSAATLTVNTAPSVTTNPANQTECEGASVNFTAASNSSPSPTVQWQVSTNGGASFSNIPGATSTTLTFNASTSQNGNQYQAVFSNSCSTATTTAATLTINPNTTATTPGDQTVCQGASASFSTTASGTGPFHYAWAVDGSSVGGDTASVSVSTGSLSGGSHTVTVIVSGTCDSVTKTATLNVNTAPVVTTNPASQTVISGNATFTAAASGIPTPTVQWQVSTNGGASFSNIPGATSTTLTFATNSGQNGNQYRAVFTNACGTATTSAATLTTCTPPVVTGSPSSVADACVGQVVNFTASANGTPTPTVQWQVSTNGGALFTNIAGATSNTLSLTASVALRNNQYRAVFTNACGSDITSAATLGVDTIAPVITLSKQTTSMWPPSHKYETFNLSDFVSGATDNCNANLLSSVVIASVTSDELEDNPNGGDGNTLNDIVIAPNCKSVQLRAERDGDLNGRVYTITFRVTDSAGNVGTATATVTVPKVQNGSAAVNDGTHYTVNGNCP
jgi:CSLREA domain-containing protein